MFDSCNPTDCSARFLCPWDFPRKYTGVGCHFFLQGIFLTQGLNPGSICRKILYQVSYREYLLQDKSRNNVKVKLSGPEEVVLCLTFPTHTRYRPQPRLHSCQKLSPAMPLLLRLQLSSFPISEQKSHRLV